MPNGKPFLETAMAWDKFPTVDLDPRSQGALRGALEQARVALRVRSGEWQQAVARAESGRHDEGTEGAQRRRDQKEVRRFRIAQFNGRTATVRSAGSPVTGYVRSIVENKSSVPAAWTITIIPEEPKPTLALRPALR